MSSIQYKKLTEGAQAPQAQYPGDAGCDLFISEDRVIPPGSFVDIPCGIAMALPLGMWGRITGRSSTIRKKKLLVIEGIIDNGYTGPLFCAVWNLSDESVTVKTGERIAQLIPHRVNVVDWVETMDLPERKRGSKGFGSSGE